MIHNQEKYQLNKFLEIIEIMELADKNVKTAIIKTFYMTMKVGSNVKMMKREIGDINRLKSNW